MKQQTDCSIPHKRNCGTCALRRLHAKYLMPLVEDKANSKELRAAIEKIYKLWKKTKYYKLVQSCLEKKYTGEQIEKEFKKMGWEP